MIQRMTAALAVALLATAAHAEGDIAAGEKLYKKCRSCHKIADGDTVHVKGGRTGPNLFGLDGRAIGAEGDFKFSKSMASLAENPENIWTEDDFVAWLQNPAAYLKQKTGDEKARSKMTFKVKDAEDAKNIWAYIVSLGK